MQIFKQGTLYYWKRRLTRGCLQNAFLTQAQLQPRPLYSLQLLQPLHWQPRQIPQKLLLPLETLHWQLQQPHYPQMLPQWQLLQLILPQLLFLQLQLLLRWWQLLLILRLLPRQLVSLLIPQQQKALGSVQLPPRRKPRSKKKDFIR